MSSVLRAGSDTLLCLVLGGDPTALLKVMRMEQRPPTCWGGAGLMGKAVSLEMTLRTAMT